LQQAIKDNPDLQIDGDGLPQFKTDARRELERAQRESLSRLFLAHWKRHELPELTMEYQFHPVRKWRFDFCLIDKRVAIEIHGGTRKQGRHNRAEGFARDREKMNAAQLLGWRVFEFSDVTLRDREAMDRQLQQISEIING